MCDDILFWAPKEPPSVSSSLPKISGSCAQTDNSGCKLVGGMKGGAGQR